MNILPVKFYNQFFRSKTKNPSEHLGDFKGDINSLKNKTPLNDSSIEVFDSLSTIQKEHIEHFINRTQKSIDSFETQDISSSYQIFKERNFSKQPKIKTCATFRNKHNRIVSLSQIIDENNVRYERNELQGKTNISRFLDSECEFYTKNTPTLTSQIIIKKDKTTKEPTHIISIKASKLLKGTFDITKYTLSDYPQDYDIMAHIKKGSICGGEILSKSFINKDGSIEYFENIPCDDMTIKRYYKKYLDGSYKYSFKIIDKNGNETLNIDRSLRKISNTKTITTINNKDYIATFDDKNRIITIEDSKGQKRTIDIAQKFKNAPKIILIMLNRFPGYRYEPGMEELFQTFKSMGADALLKFDENVNSLIYSSNEAYSFPNKNLVCSYNNLGVILHELGHCIGNKLKNDKVLAGIYFEELEAFNSKFTHSSQQFIKYFIQEEKNDLDGMLETIAESYMLSSICCYDTEFSTRAQILVHNFPRTVSYIAKKFSKNCF